MTVSGRRMQEAARLRHIASLQRKGGQRPYRILGVTVSTKGDVRVEKPVLVVSNHVGLLDSWVLNFQWLSLRRLKWPNGRYLPELADQQVLFMWIENIG